MNQRKGQGIEVYILSLWFASLLLAGCAAKTDENQTGKATTFASYDDALLANSPEIAEAMRHSGKPDAIQLFPDSHINIYYKSPPRTLVFQLSRQSWQSVLVADIKDVPRSVRRLKLHEGPLPPPWPVISAQDQKVFFRAAPSAPASPPDNIDRQKYVSYSDNIRSKDAYHEAGGSDEAARATRAFSIITEKTRLPRIEWNLRVFESSDSVLFSEPDGSIFVSRELVAQLNDAELTAILAHQMGHVRYGHDTRSWALQSTSTKVAEVAAIAVAYPILMGACFVTAPVCAALGAKVKHDEGKEQETERAAEILKEREANYAALQYLAEVNAPPDLLFDALMKLSAVEPQEQASPDDFATAHHAAESAAELGRMLDAGLIPSAFTASSPMPQAIPSPQPLPK